MKGAELGDLLARASSACLVSTVALALVAAVCRRALRDAAVRHAGLATAFILILLLPLFLQWFSPVIHYRIESLAGGALAAIGQMPRGGADGESARGLLLALGVLWAGGVGVLAVRFAAAMATLVRLCRRSTPFAGGSFDLSDIGERVGLRRPPRLRVSTADEPTAPVTWGFIHPVVLLPRGADRWRPQRLQAVLLHEFGHVRRRDSMTQALALATCALHWFNPLFWYCARRMQLEAEIACDDVVLQAGVRPSAYAAELLQFAAQLNGLPGPAALLAASMATPCTLTTRITSIVNPRAPRGHTQRKHVLAMQALCVLAVCCLCSVRPTFAAGRRPHDRMMTDIAPRSGQGASTLARNDERRPAPEMASSPDVLPEAYLLRHRARSRPKVSPAADLVGSADALKYSNSQSADRLPP
jgi:beta-lactamase regulating signal transducer with metallopeptidase domain